MIRLAADNSMVAVAWAAFDRAAIALNRIYRDEALDDDTADARAVRMAKAEEVLRLWNAWRALFLNDGDPRTAA